MSTPQDLLNCNESIISVQGSKVNTNICHCSTCVCSQCQLVGPSSSNTTMPLDKALVQVSAKRDKITELSENDTENFKEPISSLNDDCLLHIFSFLNISELIKIEKVCKKWHELSKRSWQVKKALDLEKIFDQKQLDQLKVSQLQELLLKCGENLSLLDISACTSHLDTMITCQIIGQHCKNLKILNIAGLTASKKPFPPEFVNATKTLLSLDMTSFEKLTDQLLAPLLIAAENLEEFLVSGADILGKSLKHLSKKCRHLHVSYCPSLKPAVFEKVVVGLRELEMLTIDGMGMGMSHRSLESSCQTLEEVRACDTLFFFDIYNIPASGPCQFPKLRVLDLSCGVCMYDQTLLSVAMFCPNLEELDCSADRTSWEFNSFSDNGIKILVNLGKLKVLRMDWQKEITSQSLEYLAEHLSSQLETVVFRQCRSITDSGPSKLVALCPNLKELNVAYCRKITGKLVENALSSLKLRTNDLPLELCVTGSESKEYRDGDKILLKVSNEKPSDQFVDYEVESENEWESEDDCFGLKAVGAFFKEKKKAGKKGADKHKSKNKHSGRGNRPKAKS